MKKILSSSFELVDSKYGCCCSLLVACFFDFVYVKHVLIETIVNARVFHEMCIYFPRVNLNQVIRSEYGV